MVIPIQKLVMILKMQLNALLLVALILHLPVLNVKGMGLAPVILEILLIVLELLSLLQVEPALGQLGLVLLVLLVPLVPPVPPVLLVGVEIVERNLSMFLNLFWLFLL